MKVVMAGEQNVKIAFTGKIDGYRLCPAGQTDTCDETLGGSVLLVPQRMLLSNAEDW